MTSGGNRRMRAGRGMTLGARLLIALLAAATIPVLLTSAVHILTNLAALRSEALALQSESARNAADAIDAYLAQFEDQINLALRSRRFQAGVSHGMFLDQLLAFNAGFETLSLMDGTGQEIAKKSRYLLYGPGDLTNRSASPEFAEAVSAGRYLGPISLSQYAEPLVTLSIPIENARGQLEGVLAAEINLKYMWDVVARLETSPGSYAYVVDGDGRLIAHRDSSRVLQGHDLSQLPGVAAALAGRPAAGTYAGLEGERVIGAYQGLRQAGWFVLVEAPARQALSAAYRSTWFGAAAVLVTLVLGAVLGWRLRRVVARPLRDLQRGVEIVGAGDLGHRLEIQSADEIGGLAGTFNALAGELQQTVATLEERVAERTRELEHRAAQLAIAADVGRVAASILELGPLASQVVDLIRERFDLYYAGLFLLDAAGERAVLEAGTGEAGQRMKEADHSLEVGRHSMVGAACAQREARIALDVGEEAVRFDNPLLPATRSEMALPLVAGERVLGALDVQSVVAGAFSEEEVAVLQLVADQVAVAVDNARKFSEEATLLEATNPIFRVGRRLAAAATTDDVVQTIVDAVAETEADGCAVARLGGPGEDGAETTILAYWDRRGASGFPVGVPLAASAAPLALQPVTEFWVVEDILEALDVGEEVGRTLKSSGSRAFVNIPLRAGSRAIGYVNVQRARPGPFSPVSLRLYQTMADQAAAALERTRLLEEAQRRAWREQLLGEVTSRMRETLDVETVLNTAANEIAARLDLAALDIRLGSPVTAAGGERGEEVDR